MPVYRYKWTLLDASAIQRQVGAGAIVLGSTAPAIYTDITAAVGQKTDLDAYMASQGYQFDATDPVTSVAQASAQAMLSQISGYDEGTLLAKRGGVNFIGAGVTAVDNSGADRIDVTIPGGGGSFDMRDVVIWDHFLTSNITTNTVGSMGWRVNATGTGAAVTTAVDNGRPGIIRLDTGTSAAARAAIDIGETALGARINVGAAGGSQGTFSLEFLVRFAGASSILAANLEQAMFGFGLDWAADAELPDGIYVRFTPGTDTNFSLVTASASVRTVQAGTVTPAADTWYRMRIDWVPGSPSTAQLFINGVSQGAPVSTNIPTAGLGVGFKVRSAAGVDAFVDVDYCLGTQVTKKEGA